MRNKFLVLILMICLFGSLVVVEADEGVIEIFAFGRDTVGITSDRSIKVAGENSEKVEEVFYSKGPIIDFVGKVSAIGLTTDGKSIALSYIWDEENFNEKGPYIKLAHGVYFIAGLKEDGTVYAESSFMNDKECVFPWENIVDMCEFHIYDYPHVCGLKEDGTVLTAWVKAMEREYVFEDAPENFKDIIQIDGAFNILAGIKKDGTVTAYDFTFNREILLPWSDIIDIAVRGGTIYALKTDGTVVGYNTDFDKEISMTNWYDIVSISASDNHVVALRKDGKVLAAGNNEYGQCNVESWDLTPLVGDANDDNEVNAKDALAILRVAAQMDDFGTEFIPGQWSPENAKLTNGSLESVNAKDALAVLKIAAKIG